MERGVEGYKVCMGGASRLRRKWHRKMVGQNGTSTNNGSRMQSTYPIRKVEKSVWEAESKSSVITGMLDVWMRNLGRAIKVSE
jgi:hypothetical protein